MKKIANCIHHTHWDPIWYFTPQDAMVQFTYNMRELLKGLESGTVKDFFLDGQTAAVDEYLTVHPEDEGRIRNMVSANKLFIGPFNSQLDCFISSGEAVVNNLRIGMKTADRLGGSSKIAYLPDSFGHSVDFPKIFNQMGVYDFVITRGVGDEYDLGSEFYMESNDGSRLLVSTMLSGYGYGTYPFREGSILTDMAEDYNKINVHELIDRLISKSTVKNEFVFPLGFDQNPVIHDIPEKIDEYNLKSDRYHFRLTTWEEYMNKIREKGEGLKTHKYELFSTQYHRIHKSLFSARADIKYIQDIVERTLTFEVQPLMSMLDKLGIPYDREIIDKAWETLIQCQTHSSATMTDESNEYIKVKSNSALNMAEAVKIYLMKIISISIRDTEDESMPLVIYNTFSSRRNLVVKATVYTKHDNFRLTLDGRDLDYTVIDSEKEYSGVLRKNKSLMTEDKHFYKSTIIFKVDGFNGISYKTVHIHDKGDRHQSGSSDLSKNAIVNDRYEITFDDGIHVHDKKLAKTFKNAVYIEESGDEGDNYDYSYPDAEDDLTIRHYFDDSEAETFNAPGLSEMKVSGEFHVPSDLKRRKEKELDATISYNLILRIKDDSDVIEISGSFNNTGKNHRVRIVFPTEYNNEYSYAGTQYGFIKRETAPTELEIWRENNWFEEPSPTNPLLNHVSAVSDDYTLSIFTRSAKEYEFIDKGCSDVAVTIFRSVGHLGLPDLNRRPGRPSGLDYKVFEAPDSQMLGEVEFEIGISFYNDYDGNIIMNDYINYGTDILYYQDQSFEKTVYKIGYFPTNPLSINIPEKYDFISLEGSETSFGTVVKSKDNEGYILRIFNSENRPIKGGRIVVNFDYTTIYKTDLLEDNHQETSEEIGEVKSGELLNFKIV